MVEGDHGRNRRNGDTKVSGSGSARMKNTRNSACVFFMRRKKPDLRIVINGESNKTGGADMKTIMKAVILMMVMILAAGNAMAANETWRLMCWKGKRD